MDKRMTDIDIYNVLPQAERDPPRIQKMARREPQLADLKALVLAELARRKANE